MSDLLRLVTTFHAACTRIGLGYAFVGGIAVMAWGDPRATRDVDVLVKPDASALKRLATELQHAGLVVDPHDFTDALHDGAHVTVTDPESLFHVDIKLAQNAAERAEIDEAHEVELAGVRIHVVSPEDTIAFKLAFGTEQDRQDARSIIWRLGARIDQGRLTRTAIRLDVREQLDALWEEATRVADDADAQPTSRR